MVRQNCSFYIERESRRDKSRGYLRCSLQKVSIVVKYYNHPQYYLVFQYHLVRVEQQAEDCATMMCNYIAENKKSTAWSGNYSWYLRKRNSHINIKTRSFPFIFLMFTNCASFSIALCYTTTVFESWERNCVKIAFLAS